MECMPAGEPKWRFNEFQQIGRDYSTAEEVAIYDAMHAQFRDVAAESQAILDALDLVEGATLLEFGCGAGFFPIDAARRGFTVHAADISPAMLEHAAKREGAHAVQFHHAGFLTVEIEARSLDAITTTFAFHHLPDLWKGIALRRLATMLKIGGKLYLRDVILQEENALENIAALVERQDQLGGAPLREDVEGHFREENSTYDWVMDGLLQRAGFTILKREFEGGVLGTYVCAVQDPSG